MENSSFAFHRNVSHPIEEQDALINDTEWSGNGHQFFSEDSIVPRNNNSKESSLPISQISLHDPTFSLNIPFFLLFAFSAALFMVNRRYPILQWARHILSSISPRRDNGQFEMVPLKVSAHQKRRDEVSLLIPRLYPKQSDGLSETEQMEDEVDDLAGKVSKLSKLLSKEAALNLLAALPRRFTFGTWTVVYSSNIDGFSLRTFYNASKDCKSTILLVQDSVGSIFGGFLNEPWRPSSLNIGNGETFVFQVYPEFRVFPSTKRNAFFATAKAEYIAFGGSDGLALRLTRGLSEGTSTESSTFDNCRLSHHEAFKVHAVELWHLNNRDWSFGS